MAHMTNPHFASSGVTQIEPLKDSALPQISKRTEGSTKFHQVSTVDTGRTQHSKFLMTNNSNNFNSLIGGIKLKSSINTLKSFMGPTNNTGGNSLIEAKLKSSGLKQSPKPVLASDPF